MDLATARQLFTEHGPDRVKVVYDPGDGCPAEEGVITAVTELFVFVRYGSDFGSKATRAGVLKPILTGASGAEYIVGDPIGLAPEPDSVCDAAQWGGHPTMSPDGTCRCIVCARCGHHTGNAHQDHYWAHCLVTRTTREFHMCCPDPEFGCEIEQRFAIDLGFVSLPPMRFVVACPACGSRDEYDREDPPEHTCGHKVGGLDIPTPDCGQPRDPDEDGQMWWCRPCRQYHVPKRDPDLLRAAQLMLEDAEQRFDAQGRPVIDDD